VIGRLFKSIFRGKAEDDEPPRYGSSAGSLSAVRSADAASAEGRRHWITNPWHAVGVAPCLGACTTAQKAANVRYLSSEAPVLPLAGCSNKKCSCRYRHFQDRRGSPRRDSDIIGPRMGWPGRERRVAQGRRSTDGV
jgi:hypothetical protein